MDKLRKEMIRTIKYLIDHPDPDNIRKGESGNNDLIPVKSIYSAIRHTKAGRYKKPTISKVRACLRYMEKENYITLFDKGKKVRAEYRIYERRDVRLCNFWTGFLDSGLFPLTVTLLAGILLALVLLWLNIPG